MSVPIDLDALRWILPKSESPVHGWLKTQISELVRQLSGTAPTFERILAPGPSNGVSHIVVGTVGDSSYVDAAVKDGLIRLDHLSGDDFVVKSIRLENRDVIVVTSRTIQGATYGVFELFEQAGCRYLISRDVIPRGAASADSSGTFRIEDYEGRTDCAWRGIWFQYCFATNSIMSLSDYEAMFDQMAKMRLNRIVFYHFENEPFIDYSYQGERKLVGDISHSTSGYISYGRHFSGSYLAKDLPVGAEVFDREHVAPLELQHVASSEAALETAGELMRRIMDVAAVRGVGCWTSFLPSFLPMNLAKYARRMPRPHIHWSSLVSFTDPVIDEINRIRIRAILESYPNVEGIFLAIPEGYYEDPYPESRAILERERPKYARPLELHKKYWGDYWNNDEKLLEDHIVRDIGFVELLKRTIAIAREIKPDIKLGVLTVCKAYLLTHLHKVLPKDICFADIESRSLWTVRGAPLFLFKEMKGRECLIIPRAVDDGSLAGMQFNLELYDKDAYIRSARENGTSGLIIQTTHIRGNEHNMGYLANGMWNSDLTPDGFYADYVKTIFGEEAARTVLAAFDSLEECEVSLGGRGLSNMPWNKVPAQIEVLRRFKSFATPFHSAPYDCSFVRTCVARSEKYVKAIEYLEQADALYQEAEPHCSEEGKRELNYIKTRNRGYCHHLRALVLLSDLYGCLLAAFDLLNPRERASKEEAIPLFKEALAKVITTGHAAEKHARKSAENFTHCSEHPTDLGVLWMVGSSMVIGTELLRQYLENIAAYYDGREYWAPIRWENLFDTCPYPSYGLEEVKISDSENYEPG